MVAALVDSRARRDYDRLLLVKYTLLYETLRNSSAAGAAAAAYLQENLAPLGNLTANVLIKKATPFFRLNVQKCYNAASADDAESLTGHARNLVLMAFDSFFEQLPYGHAVRVEREEGSDIILPRLGVRVAAPGGAATLRRLDAALLEVQAAEGPLVIDTRDVAPDFKLPSFSVPDSPGTILLACDPALFEEDYISNIELDTEHALSLSAQIGKSLSLIRRVDATLGSQIDSHIQWYIPLVNPNPDTTHYSFTAKNLLGVMFLSGSYRFLPLCEAIVHEYHHHELYVLMATQDVLGEQTDKRYYSPWRTDARPLSGLFHALHVFTGVSDFYSRVMQARPPELETFEKDIRYRRVLLYHQLRIGLAQVEEAELPPLGRRIYKHIEEELGRLGAELGAHTERMPEAVFTHFGDWSTLYPELVPAVRLPAEFASRSNV